LADAFFNVANVMFYNAIEYGSLAVERITIKTPLGFADLDYILATCDST